MEQQPIPVNPTILQWARIEAGLSLYEAAARAKVTSPRKRKDEDPVTPEKRLEAWENGREAPSLNQLEKIADAYRRPLITFFLQAPPEKAAIYADFRTLNNRLTTEDTPEFSALKRRITLLHRELCDLAAEEGRQELSFVGSLEPTIPVPQFVAELRKTLGVTFSQQRNLKTENDLLGYLRELAHNIGVFVLFEGDVGSYHSRILPDEFRGIAIADKVVPLIVVNSNDAKAAMVFTIVHELAHIWLGTSGISNFNALAAHGGNGGDERLCNAVAAEFLVPETEIRSAWRRTDLPLHQIVEPLAKQFKVSGAVVSRRLLDTGFISDQEYGSLLAWYNRRWVSHKEQSSKGDGGPSRNILDGYRLGMKTVQTFLNAANDGRISFQDAARILNIPVSRFDKVAR